MNNYTISSLIALLKLGFVSVVLVSGSNVLAAETNCDRAQKIGQLASIKCDIKVNRYQRQISASIFNANGAKDEISKPLNRAKALSNEEAALGQHRQLINYMNDDSRVRGRVLLSQESLAQDLKNHAIAPSSKATQLINVIQ